jgi:hypothetical protein
MQFDKKYIISLQNTCFCFKTLKTTQPIEASELAPRKADMFDDQSAFSPSLPVLSKDSMMSVVMRREAF